MSCNKIKVAHIITRMIIGGAQENTYYSVLGLQKDINFQVKLITGEEIGPEGRLSLEGIEDIIFEKNLVRNINPLKDLICFLKLFIIFRKEKFDIIHTHSSKAGIIARIAAYCSRTKVIIHTIHGLPFHDYQSRFLNMIYIFLESFCAKFTNKIIVVADEMKKKALKKGIGREKQYQTIHSGMNLQDFLNARQYRKTMREQLNIAEDDIVIGKIARLFPLKGHEYVVNIAEQLIEENKNIKFLFVGNGILYKTIKEKISQLGIEKHFIFTGLIEPQMIPKYLSCFDILVHTSLREGLARVLPQSLAAGIPVVSFDIDGAKEVIKDNETGFLVEPANERELYKKINLLINNNKLVISFVQNGKKIIEPYFSYQYMVMKINELYKQQLEKA